jgi:hypothetical protein
MASASEAIQNLFARREWIASSLALPCANASRLSQAMTEEEPAPKLKNLTSNQRDSTCPALPAKIFRFALPPNQTYIRRHPGLT